MPRTTIVIVDPLGVGRELVAACERRDVAVVPVYSGHSHPQETQRHDAGGDPKARIDHQGDIEATCRKLCDFRPSAVIAGCETGVELADALSAQLGTKSNGTALSGARRDKHLMTKALHGKGLRTIPQRRATQLSPEVFEWCERLLRRGKQIVVKPPKSGGTDQVHFCSCLDAIRTHFAQIIRRPNRLGIVNDCVLLQERICGDEYVVNTVANGEQPTVTEVWKYHKRTVPGGATIYDWDELVAPEDPVVSLLLPYVGSVLVALGIRFGPAHTEVMIDEAGPVLVETGARIDGMANPKVAELTTPRGQIELTLDAYLATRAENPPHSQSYTLLRHASNVSLITTTAGFVRSLDGLQRLRQLRSYVDHKLHVELTSQLSVTHDYFSSPGTVFLVHLQRDTIMQDYDSIREQEALGLFI